MKHLGDITGINGGEIEPVDIIAGGSPCQDLSIAGKRAGLSGKRSGLFMEQIRIIKEMREADAERGRTDNAIRPRYMVWENVKGAFSSNKGQDFAAILEETIRIVEPDAPAVPVPTGGWPRSGCLYDEMGRWSVAWRVHDAQFWGVPQRRARISLVADFGGLAAPEVSFERKGLCWRSEEGEAAEEETAGAAGNGAEDAGMRGAVGEGAGAWEGASAGAGEVSAYCLQGNGIDRADTAGCNGRGWCENVSYTLNTIDRPAVVYDARGNGDGKTVCTITGDHENRITDYTALCIGNGQAHNVEPTPLVGALNCMHDQQAVVVFDKEMYNSGKNAQGESQASYDIIAPTVRADDHPSGVMQNMIVRRLTPKECDLLQGYPPDWTQTGTWTDTKGKKHNTSDSNRYKADGNSIALPFWFWLLRRISAQYERPATLGSLFDGIGGFPLCWERCNGKGSALWASEIDEFAIAVTKYHFPEEEKEI